MQDASFVFGDNASVEIDSKLERCTIALGSGSELILGPSGVLLGCRVAGASKMLVHGTFVEEEGPGISGVGELQVSERGQISGTVEQGATPTRFGFERGCKLRLKITAPKGS